MVTFLLLLLGCVVQVEPDGAGEEGSYGEHLAVDGIAASESLDVRAGADNACSTSIVRALSEQLLDEMACMAPGVMGRIDDIQGVELGSGAFPYLQRPAAEALRAAAGDGSRPLRINSSLRTLPQQYILYRWYQQGRCGVSLAARPGRSNHESGLAIDIQDSGAWRAALERNAFSWLGPRDPVHFDYEGSEVVDLQSYSVRAFQRLWNRNHPDDRIDEDGQYGPATARRLAHAPALGFPLGPVCEGDP